MTKHMIPAVILVGGKGTRMGGVEKPLLKLADRTLLDHVIERLRPQVSAIALATPQDASAYSEFRFRLLPDDTLGQGPLTGLSSAMRWAKEHHSSASHVALLAGDTPFLPHDLIERLADKIQSKAVCVFAQSKDQIHYSTGFWPLSSHATLQTYRERSEDRSLRGLARQIGFHSVEWSEDEDPFFNINTPEELERAETRIVRLNPR
ncbi:MAG: molybdenum cofactor guanylyltransferase [Alphaproteobacteria bacterium]|jgi:molybdopterin-guanine dinucleotide biosynthesis protein A|nr:molybdenum cofactor guanylyltransferase [Alphaproteobacteria bacterium]